MIKKKVLLILGLLGIVTLVIAAAGCSKGASAAQGPFKQTTITATVSENTVSIPASVVNLKSNVHFDYAATQGTASFSAYSYKGEIQVRANYCVPCRGRSFTLKGDQLICDNCGTIFSAKDGSGISGVQACKSYPKAAVPFTTTAEGNIVMNKADLVTAFNNTISPGLP